MPGTRSGAKTAAEKNKARYGEDFYARIGRIGGQRGRTGGFHARPDLASIAGKKGGTKSRRRGPSKHPYHYHKWLNVGAANDNGTHVETYRCPDCGKAKFVGEK